MSRSLSEVTLRATVPLTRAPEELRVQCVTIARESSPSTAFNLAWRAALVAGFDQLQVLGIAKATRWLAVIRRDHGIQQFDDVTRTLVPQSTRTA